MKHQTIFFINNLVLIYFYKNPGSYSPIPKDATNKIQLLAVQLCYFMEQRKAQIHIPVF